MAMRCAERTGSCTILWQHEFYMVKEPQYGAYLYQAVEFRVGSNLAADEVEGSTLNIKAEEGGVGTGCGVCACAACEKI